MFNKELEEFVVFIIYFGIIFVFFVVFIVLVVKQHQDNFQSNQRYLDELITIHDNELFKSQIEIQEQTFQHISQEIHDNIGQKLTLAKLNLNRLDSRFLGENINSVNNTIQIIGEVISDLSDLSRTMSSEVVLQNGLIKAIEYEITQLNRAGIYKLKMQVIGDGAFLEAKRELILFRVVQESLNNIIKHADATEITIRLHYANTSLRLEIHDNGKGYRLEEKDGKGNGLSNIRRRASILNGRCHINTSPGNGTMIQIEIPIDGQEQHLEGHPGR